MLKYTGGFSAEKSYFEGHDKAIVGYLNTISEGLTEFNDAWRDVDSEEFLKSCKTSLEEAYKLLNTAHGKVEEYFKGIQDILNSFLGTATIELPSLETVTFTDATAFEDTVIFNNEAVPSIVSKISEAARDMISDIQDFSPSATSFAGSSSDILDTITANLTAAASAYQVLESPASAIKTACKNIMDTYNSRISAIK